MGLSKNFFGDHNVSFGRYSTTGKRFLSINEGYCPSLYIRGGFIRLAVRTFLRVYVIKWEKGKGFSFERNKCLPKWIEPLLMEISDVRIRVRELENRQRGV